MWNVRATDKLLMFTLLLLSLLSQLKKRTFHDDSDDDEVVFEKTLVLERSQCLKMLRNVRIHML